MLCNIHLLYTGDVYLAFLGSIWGETQLRQPIIAVVQVLKLLHHPDKYIHREAFRFARALCQQRYAVMHHLRLSKAAVHISFKTNAGELRGPIS